MLDYYEYSWHLKTLRQITHRCGVMFLWDSQLQKDRQKARGYLNTLDRDFSFLDKPIIEQDLL